MKYKIKVVNQKTGEVVKILATDSERKADKIEMGLLRQMDRDNYYVAVESKGR